MNSKKKFIISMLVVSFVLLSIIATVAIAFALTQQTIKTSLNIGYTVEDIDGTASATFTIGGVTENLTAMKGENVIGDKLVFKAGDREDAGNLMFPEDALALTSQNDNVVIQYTYTNSGSKHYIASMSLDSNIDQENMKIEYSINGTDYSEQRYAVVVPAGAINISYWVKISIKDKAKSASCTGDFKWLLAGCDEQSKDYLTISSLLFQETEVPGEYQASIESPGEYIGEIIFPSKVLGYNVTQIAESTLPDNQKALVKKVTIPDSITSINDNAFKDFTEIEYVTLDQNNVSVSSVAQASGLIKIGSSAFENCSSLRNFIIPSTVAKIGAKAFKDCSALNEINIKNTEGWFVADSSTATSGISINSEDLSNPTIAKNYLTSTYVDKYWLKDLNDSPDTSIVLILELNSDENSYYVKECLTSATGSLDIPATYKNLPVTRIGEFAFDSCVGLTNITIPNSITAIDNSAFIRCSSLINMQIPNSVTSMGAWAFSDCTNLQSVQLPNKITEISEHMFYSCSSLTNIQIPERVISIGKSSFENSGLTNLVMPSGIALIEEKAFMGCSKLTSVEMPSNVLSIEDSAFSTTGLISVEIPNSLIHIGDNVFSFCTDLQTVQIGTGLTSVGKEMFSNCEALTSVEILANITSIGDKAFYNCQILENITIPESVKSIGDWAFGFCYAFTSIEIGNNVVSIGASAFGGCNDLNNVTFVNTEGWYVADSATATSGTDLSSTDLEISSTAATYLKMTYYNKYWINKELQDKIVDPLDVLTFELNTDGNSYCITGCLESATGVLKIPEIYQNKPVTSIADEAFYGCALQEIIISDSVTTIGEGVFQCCESLESLILGKGLLEIPANPFFYTDKLCNLQIVDGNSRYYSIDNCIIEKDTNTLVLGCKTSLIPIDGSVTIIGDDAFVDCLELKSVVISDSITSIGRFAFYGCTALTSVTFENASGWFVADSSSATSGTDLSSTDLENTSTAATYLTSTYGDGYWKRG